MMRIAIATILLLANSSAWAQQCSSSEAQAAESSIDSLDSWQSVYIFYKRYRHCDDGSIAEGHTDKVVHLLATRWDSLKKLQKITARDHRFQTFILRHIDSSALTSELDHVAYTAARQCPQSATQLCKQIIGASNHR
jgi:hypothetical protein